MKFNLCSGEKKISDMKNELYNINKYMTALFNNIILIFISLFISFSGDIIVGYNIMNIREDILYGYALLGINIMILIVAMCVCGRLVIENLRNFHYRNVIFICLGLSLIQNFIVCFDIKRYLSGEVYLSNVLSLFVLFTYVLSSFINMVRLKRNMLTFLSKKSKKAIYKCVDNKNIIKRKYVEKMQICYSDEMKDIEDYKIEYQNVTYNFLFSKFSLIILIISIMLSGFLIFFYKIDILSVTGAMIILNTLAVPSTFLVIFSNTSRKLNRKLSDNGIVVFNYEDLKEISNISTIVIDAKDLYSPQYVEVKEMRVFKGNLLDEAIIYASSISKSRDTTLKFTFDNTVSVHHRRIRKADKISYIDNKGIISSIHGKRVLIGNSELMAKYGISIPVKLYNISKRTDMVFIAINNDLVAMFYIYYKPHKYVGEYLNRLLREGVGISIKTFDPNITASKISKDFDIDYDMIYILSEGEYNDYLKSGKNINIFTDGRSSSMFRMIVASGKFKENRLLIAIMQIFFMIISTAIISFIMIMYKTCLISPYDILLCNIILSIVCAIALRIKK